ncbi:hypothetical protein LWP59_39840 [Amycolatopsis acidiphila]|uniref:Uncharacterized protein n=1 Tax=Amycolatopsis acidiphila TaxID=715473 RepID=A0A558A6S6_9PSEU|nr:hypothetical protein [Amycolatopsis acidiphila]TVT19952.1 hypothetical protein FNH06_22510 [Amycolatopsis acidiphila]UIJ60056.1 hypothetical protein LWP59_39840 [Amycolatopsis acidiphila]GHG61602.1 hypothetical protein GCM10017788_16480 [Amycolatopsis acidiphila]
MFLVYCPTCDRHSLLGVDEVDCVHNLSPGVISVSGTCPRGHPAVLLTGEAFTPRADPRVWQPSPWVRLAGRQRRWWSRLFEIRRDLPAMFARF